MNTVMLAGRIAQEVKVTQGGAAFVRLAVQGSFEKAEGKRRTDFLDICLVGASEGLVKVLEKGRSIAVNGELQNSTTEKDGEKRNGLRLVAFARNGVTLL
jgi:single-stranded DNA-binding protein